MFNAPTTLGCTAAVFEAAGALDSLERFCSVAGAARYGLAPSTGRTVLVRRDAPAPVPAPMDVVGDVVVSFDPGVPLHWSVDRGPADRAGG